MQQLLGLRSVFPQLGGAKLAMLGLVAAAVLGAVAFVAVRPSEQMGLLYAGLDPSEAGKVGQRLDELKVQYEARGDGGTLYVPVSQVPKIRMELAASGLPHQGGAGYELLDSQSPMNMTSFMQRIQHVRALEGELARTIATMNGVKSSRVHLVLPEREGFSRDVPQPTASVTVTMSGAGRLSASQAAAIRLLVAGAVPRMRGDDVSVLDPSGVVLAADGGGGLAAGRLDEMRTAEEQEMAGRVVALLEPMVGRGRVRVAASMDLSTERETQREEKFDPLAQVERSRQTQNDRDTSDESKAAAPVSVGQNVPNQGAGGGAGGGGNKNSTSSAHNSETVNYEISSTTSERVHEPGDLKRMTVAVVLNGGVNAEGQYVPRPQEELDRIGELVRSAVGYNEKRGDKVTVQTMRFLANDPLGTSSDGTDAQPGSALPLRIIVPGAAIALLAAGGGIWMLTRGRKAPAMAAIADGHGAAGNLPAVAGGSPDDLFSISAVGGVPRSPALQQLHNLVDDRPDEAVAVLRGWIMEGAGA